MLVHVQGGQLIIQGGTAKSKLPGFVDPTSKSILPSFLSFKAKKQLLIVWSDRHVVLFFISFYALPSDLCTDNSKGAHTRTYGDTEPVFIKYS